MKKGRKPKVCDVCLGNAETTRDELKCDGDFGGKICNEWLWGWFLVDETVHRAAKSYKEVDISTSPNTSSPKLPDIKEVFKMFNMWAKKKQDRDGNINTLELIEAIYEFIAGKIGR